MSTMLQIRLTKETCKRDLQKRPAKEIYMCDAHYVYDATNETYERDL